MGRGRADRKSAQLKGLEKQNKTKHQRATTKKSVVRGAESTRKGTNVKVK